MKKFQLGDVVSLYGDGEIKVTAVNEALNAYTLEHLFGWYSGSTLELVRRPEPAKGMPEPGPITGGYPPVKPSPVPQVEGEESNPRFNRGDRVEAVWHEDGKSSWRPAIYLHYETGGGAPHVVSFDHASDVIHGISKDHVRRPVLKVKRTMQDWICLDKSGNPELAWVLSRVADIPFPPGNLDAPGEWCKSGAPYEREFEVPEK